MLRFKLKTLAQRPRGATIVLPIVQETVAAQAAVLKIARGVLRHMARVVRSDILLVVTAERAFARRSTMDAAIRDDMFDGLRALTANLLRVAERMIAEVLNAEGQRHTRNFKASAKRAMGVDLEAVVRGSDIERQMQDAALRAAGLIKGLADETIKNVSTVILNGVLQGGSIANVKAELQKVFEASDRRAQFIARDQLATVNAELNRIRQQQAGVTTYIWRTMGDERVRGNPDGKYPHAKPSHWAREGKQFRYDEPPAGGHPGQDFGCRCYAQAVIEF